MPRRFHTDGSGHLHDHAWKIGVGPDGMAEEIGLLNDLSSQVERLTAVVEAAKEYRAHLDRLEAEVARLRSPIKPCHWDTGMTECGQPIIPGLEENDLAEFCPYCGGLMEVWVEMGTKVP